MSELAQRCAVCGTYDKPTRLRLVDTGTCIELRCNDCLYFGTSGPPPKDPDRKPRRGESLTAWLARTGRKRPETCGCRADGVEPCRLHGGA